MVGWGDFAHVVVNGLAGLVVIAAAVWILSPAGRRARRPGWKWTVAFMFCLPLSLYVDGFCMPLGAFWILFEACQSRSAGAGLEKSPRPT